MEKINNRKPAWNLDFLKNIYGVLTIKSSWRNRLARSTVNREVVGSIPTEDDHFMPLNSAVLFLPLMAPSSSILHDLLS